MLPACLRKIVPASSVGGTGSKGREPVRIELRHAAPPRPRRVTVAEAHVEPVATPALPRASAVREARLELPVAGQDRGQDARSLRVAAVYGVRVQAAARPVRVVLAGTAPTHLMPAEALQARPEPAATPRRPAARSGPVVAQPVRVRPVQLAAPAAPAPVDLAALETPPSLQEIADQLYEEIYAGQDAEAAMLPADSR